MFYDPDGFRALIAGDSAAINRAVKPDPGLEMGYASPAVHVAGGAISRTSSCPASGDGFSPAEKNSLAVGREGFKKRKANDKAQPITKVIQEDDSREKRVKGNSEGESKMNNSRENSGETNSKENSKVCEVQKPDYIHVRARRGQATDSHSLAERVRREKISERMKYLQDLVPGCNKITGKAGMLDEIINYVQSLQRQVEFLSMKLAAVNPRLDFNIEDLFAKEILPPCSAGFQMSPEMSNNSGGYAQFNPIQQMISCGALELEMGLSSHDLALRRTISTPVAIPDQSFLDTSCYAQIQPQPTWDSELQNLFSAFPSQPLFTGSIEASNLKMEM